MEFNKEKKIYIFTATAGAGHLMAANAIKETYEILFPSWNVKVIDVLDYTNIIFKKNYSENYMKIVNTIPELWVLYERQMIGFNRKNIIY